ncbi:uncharacterized protein BO95DRAFT_437930 [Aspergillus brunneoviolaceus CBS 621.78]|uniref:Uncharacterized protein n=1 Tax=Aspergillus brunneoviolaceus CBS 621.78 TaxID=1450534 RepID=A0ACD1GQ39_9EURO|nr:hypothetical protein BO95DRAFT_437930 [Aspergillus brunneoviolaceus CBS 621.78]RAH51181.1 hypothetical protein BO95DRAFT_437930 [Aspergillus brunneoviolaceus CBS 621.78]
MSPTQRFYGSEYRAVEDSDNPDEVEGPTDAECKYPAFPPKSTTNRNRYIITGIIWSGLLLLGSFLGLGIVLTVLLAVETDNTGFSTDNPDYALYKNTGFKECISTPVSALPSNCSVIRESLRSEPGGVLALLRPHLRHSSQSWCEVMSCFQDFKIIPSMPRPSAFWPTALDTWNKTAITFFMATWQVNKLHQALYSKKGQPCRGIEWDTWVILAWDLGSFVWWCVGLGRFAVRPAYYSPPSMLGWITLWKYCYITRYHPYSCVLRRAPRKAQIIRWTLTAVATLQWAASAYLCLRALHFRNMPGTPKPAYDCLEARFATAPGTTTCTPAQICATPSLLHSFSLQWPNQRLGGWISDVAFFAALSVLAIIMVAVIGLFPRLARLIGGGNLAKWRRRAATVDFGFAGNVCLAGVACTIYGGMTVVDAVRAFGRGREAAVVFNYDCTALHVNVSPWRYYLDVDYELPVRVARMWFNA